MSALAARASRRGRMHVERLSKAASLNEGGPAIYVRTRQTKLLRNALEPERQLHEY